MSNIPEHLKRYIRNQITVDEDALIKLLQDKDKEIDDLKHAVDSFESMATEFKKEIEHLKRMKHAELEDKYEGRIETLEEQLEAALQDYNDAKKGIEELKGIISMMETNNFLNH